MIYKILIGGLLFAGALAFLRRQLTLLHEAEKAKSRSPFKEKLLRPAGESLRLKIEEIREELMESVFVLSAAILSPSIVVFIATTDWRLTLIIWVVLGAAGYWIAFRQWQKLKSLRSRLRNYRLGFDGERYVAEKLSALTEQSYRIFHDFVFDMKPGGDRTTFNIDHIVVGTAGVFALETKTWRQPINEMPGEQESYQVRASGDVLYLPKGKTQSKPQIQAKRNAEDLSRWLTGSSPRVVPVIPLVVMPGWQVTDDKTGSVRVLSGRPVAKMLLYEGRKGTFTDTEVRAIADRIEAHCRNVEGA